MKPFFRARSFENPKDMEIYLKSQELSYEIRDILGIQFDRYMSEDMVNNKNLSITFR